MRESGRRGKVGRACAACRKAHLRCDMKRPCERCVKKGLECTEASLPSKPMHKIQKPPKTTPQKSTPLKKRKETPSSYDVSTSSTFTPIATPPSHHKQQKRKTPSFSRVQYKEIVSIQDKYAFDIERYKQVMGEKMNLISNFSNYLDADFHKLKDNNEFMFLEKNKTKLGNESQNVTNHQ